MDYNVDLPCEILDLYYVIPDSLEEFSAWLS